jgi:anti-sigma B factor antagonist
MPEIPARVLPQECIESTQRVKKEREISMPEANVTMTVRTVTDTTSIIDIQGDISAFAEHVLMAAYVQAATPATRAVILNFSGLEYMNSSGIGLLVTLLIRANRQKQRLLAYGLGDHYRHIFELTRLNEAISIYDSESAAVAAAPTS